MDRPRSPRSPPSGALNGKTPQFAGSCFVGNAPPRPGCPLACWMHLAVKQEAEEGLSR
jgi:hypothetical protein